MTIEGETILMGIYDLFRLDNKTAIITGGGRGLGEQMAYALAEAGANIVICSRKIDACRKVAKEIEEKFHVQTLALPCDISNKQQIEEVVQTIVDQFGTIDILVNNSGVSWSSSLFDLEENQWDKVMDINLKGTFLFSQAVAKVMKKQKSGKIINISSVLGLLGVDPRFVNTIAYNTSKGAIIALTRDLSAKLGFYGITVNALAPGLFQTDLTKSLDSISSILLDKIPLKRFGISEDLKATIVYLASPASNYVTGHTLVIDGGITINL